MQTPNKSTMKSAGRAGRGRGIQGRGRGGRATTSRKSPKGATGATMTENFFKSYGIDTKAVPNNKRGNDQRSPYEGDPQRKEEPTAGTETPKSNTHQSPSLSQI